MNENNYEQIIALIKENTQKLEDKKTSLINSLKFMRKVLN